jgi:hypothetical protein
MKPSEPTIMAAYVWRKICSTCMHSILPAANDYPICKSGKFKEVDRKKMQCLHKSEVPLSRASDELKLSDEM